ncbi:MAG: radical SAM family heme chaperone HemW [Terriglobia bacterium]
MNQSSNSLMETLGLYVQIPFCASKCSFCNFSSQVAPTNVFEDYVRSIEREAALFPARASHEGLRANLARLPVNTVYFGGGTPTLLGAERLGRIFGALCRHYDLTRVVETTLEMTPGSASAELLERLSRLRVSRLSVGAQSFDDRELRSTGRLHSAADTVAQVSAARAAGFHNINLDLLAGLPHQTLASWQRSLDALARLEPEHVSVYLFEADEKSRLGREILRHGDHNGAKFVPDEDFMARAYEAACEFLENEGYKHYEISNFAQPGFESIHNRRYWQRQPYLGLGAGAHSFDGAQRWANETAPADYQAKLAKDDLPIVEKHSVDSQAEMEEYFFLGLRERRGVSLDYARRRWPAPPLNGWMTAARRLERDGLLQERGGRLRLTKRAYLLSNEVFQEFLG